MAQEDTFPPIDLVHTNIITREGYYPGEIVRCEHRSQNGRPFLEVEFRIFKGKYRDFKLSTGFYNRELKGKVRLTHLCKAVGIRGRLENPAQLISRKLILRVVPKKVVYQGRRHKDYRITRFHSSPR